MANIKELTEELEKLEKQISVVLSISNYRGYEDLSYVQYSKTPDDLFLVEEYKNILRKLSDIQYDIEYLSRTVAFEDTLTLRPDGRYGCKNHDKYYTSGTLIEFLYYDDFLNDEGAFSKLPVWRCSRIEHNGNDYYIVGCSDVDLNNLRVRVRK